MEEEIAVDVIKSKENGENKSNNEYLQKIAPEPGWEWHTDDDLEDDNSEVKLKIFPCKNCNVNAMSEDEMKRHMRDVHQLFTFSISKKMLRKFRRLIMWRIWRI